MTSPSATPDDLDAVRTIADTLKAFQPDDQRRILRWAQEKLGLAVAPAPPAGVRSPSLDADDSSAPPGPRTDIKAFLQAKRPTSDVQFAAAVAYFFTFEAASDARKDEIGPSDLHDAARLSGRARLSKPGTTLNNAVRLGYLDRGRSRGAFRINTVGENLVAMAMPAANEGAVSASRPKARSTRKTKKRS